MPTHLLGQSLHELAEKIQVYRQAWQAGRTAEIRDYCETDVINTYLVYNRFRRLRGELTAEAEVAEGEFVRAELVRLGAPHWREFLAAWH